MTWMDLKEDILSKKKKSQKVTPAWFHLHNIPKWQMHTDGQEMSGC